MCLQIALLMSRLSIYAECWWVAGVMVAGVSAARTWLSQLSGEHQGRLSAELWENGTAHLLATAVDPWIMQS